MPNQIAKEDRLICPKCKGNGFTTVPYHLAKEEIWANCEECDSQGYIPGNKWDTHGRRPIG
jgi:DnaJ-class molecular chaperone